MTETARFNPNGEIPNHVAIIMDGNGRWAKERGLKRTAGHREGLRAIKRVVVAAAKLQIKVVTVYAFSTENWKRPKSEVAYIMQLPGLLQDELLPELMANNVKVQIMGKEEHIPIYTKHTIKQVIQTTQNNTGLILNIAFNYGGRDEIVQATKEICQEVRDGKLTLDQVDETTLSAHLKTACLREFADPDLLIRSSGEVRLSNFLLWQLAYAEMYFTSVKWPDFDEETFLDCLAAYQGRNRRYGGLS
ncbi:isoprenyl transferase [Aerococcus christensenii]|uniref:Isoprenyl transferase n=1 Tax=Aerococcus christensenii TaxID=87541 RepID=A0A133XQJ8_9LACT|nr:isoprenyl transferase [Aerococcus christensenii]KXB33193.1 di-trans,poly-cis-decaprenylcistransferase [Aerococcus christensenii]MDK8233435.1 isoprenyl transferase [Aerococcus christensenii]